MSYTPETIAMLALENVIEPEINDITTYVPETVAKDLLFANIIVTGVDLTEDGKLTAIKVFIKSQGDQR